MKTVELDISGMSCGHCVAAVDKALRAVKGVKASRVSVGHASVEIEDETPRDTLVTAIEEEGYQVVGR